MTTSVTKRIGGASRVDNYYRRRRLEGLLEAAFFNRYNKETQMWLILWLEKAGFIDDWEVIDENGELVIQASQERIDRWWRENVGS